MTTTPESREALKRAIGVDAARQSAGEGEGT